jgi:hypothetical protein
MVELQPSKLTTRVRFPPPACWEKPAETLETGSGDQASTSVEDLSSSVDDLSSRVDDLETGSGDQAAMSLDDAATAIANICDAVSANDVYDTTTALGSLMDDVSLACP